LLERIPLGDDDVQVVAPVRRRDRTLVAACLVGLPAVVPSALHAISGAGRYVDDWAFIAAAQLDGAVASREEWSARPGQALIHTLEFGLLGDHIELLVLLLGVVNALASVLLVQLLKPAVGLPTALAAGLVFSVLPNRGATSLWASTLPNVVSLCLVLALGYFSRWRRGAVLAAAVLTYEGCAALGLGVAAWLAFRGATGTKERARAFLIATSPALAAIVYAKLATPKTEGLRPFFRVTGVAASHFGIGVWPRPLLCFALLLVAALAWSVGLLVLPGFHAGRPERLVVSGFISLFLGILPFIAVGFPMATDGMLDRANIFGNVGLAMLIVGAVSLVARSIPSLQAGIIGALVIVLGYGTHADLRDARQARRDGDQLLTMFRACLDRMSPTEPVLVQPVPNRGGWGAFAEDYDISAAFRLNDPLRRPWRARTFATEEEFIARSDDSTTNTFIHHGPRAGCE